MKNLKTRKVSTNMKTKLRALKLVWQVPLVKVATGFVAQNIGFKSRVHVQSLNQRAVPQSTTKKVKNFLSDLSFKQEYFVHQR